MPVYDEKFYKGQGDRSLKSAKVVVPIIVNMLDMYGKNSSVVDVGCGVGTWAKVFTENIGEIGVVIGIDGGEINTDMLKIQKDKFISHDLAKPIKINQRFDLAISLEVAEHLPSENARQFVKTLTDLSDIVVFSAAIPYQTGINHVNCQWPSYWIKIFSEFGYKASDCIRERIWNNKNVAAYYAQNMFLYYKETEENKRLINRIEAEIYNSSDRFDCVNPRFWIQTNEIPYFKFFNKIASNSIIGSFYRRIKYRRNQNT